ncbi:MAG: hypothetical protein RL660_558 [Bacteroidota bacterium]|jgi:hypothetical protein
MNTQQARKFIGIAAAGLNTILLFVEHIKGNSSSVLSLVAWLSFLLVALQTFKTNTLRDSLTGRLLLICTGVYFIAILARIQHWPFGNIAYMVVIVVATILYIIMKFEDKHETSIYRLWKAVFFTSFLLRMLFTVQHWPHYGLLPIINTISIVVLSLLFTFETKQYLSEEQQFSFEFDFDKKPPKEE